MSFNRNGLKPGFRTALTGMGKRVEFYGLKLPLMLILITGGLLLEFVIQAPFMIGYYIDRCFKAKQDQV